MVFRISTIAAVLVALTATGVCQDAPPAQLQVSTFEELVAMLDRDKIKHEPKTEEQYTVIPINKGGMSSAQLIRWAPRDGVVHFIQVIPLQVADEHLAEVESAIVRLNHSYPVPGLGMNHDNKTVYFRLTAPLLPRGHFNENEIKEYFSFCVNQAIQFMPTINAVATGEVPAAEALSYHRKLIQASIGPLGKWQREFGGSQWVLTINQKGEVSLLKDGQVVVDSMAKFEKDQITFDDITGPLAVDGVGTYTFKVENQTLTFTAVEDESDGRKQVLSGGPWTR